ncbi:hypothetical protein LJC71_11300 [Desulfosarcina sp. OttesenSCG-928-A07]|nr:hypothetical protein [Desulfosarcina sp. OttesenSCG-928-G17]MDL2330303.1 hypothetical protein [Desulfosarcina sp. OttesenSCG-928-A07]
MLENLVSSVEVNARQFRVQKTNGAVLPFAFDICTPSILVFRDRKKHFYCLKVAYPEHGPDYFLLGTVQKEAEKLRRALCLTSFVEETPVSNAIGSWAALPVKSDQPEAEHPFGKTFVSESSSLKKKAGRRVVPEISCKCPAPAGETLIFSLPWVEEEVTGLTLPMKILVSLALGLVIAVIVTEILSGASLIISGVICLLLAGGISWVWTKRTTVCAFYAGLAGLYVAYDDGRLVLYAYASCRFLKYWNTHGELTSLFLQVFSDQERKSIFDQLFDGKEKELDELLHALVIGSERGRQRHGGN